MKRSIKLSEILVAAIENLEINDVDLNDYALVGDYIYDYASNAMQVHLIGLDLNLMENAYMRKSYSTTERFREVLLDLDYEQVGDYEVRVPVDVHYPQPE